MSIQTKEENTKTSKFPWFSLVVLAATGQIAWAVENTWFNTFVFDKITKDPRPIAWMVALPMLIGPAIGSALIRRFGIPATLNGESGFIPVPIIFVVGAIISLFALIPWLFLKNHKHAQTNPVNLGAGD